MRNIRRGEGLPAVLALWALGFAYGVVHALGPGHGKAVVAAYFMDRTRHWSMAIFAASWFTLRHTLSAILIVLVLSITLGMALTLIVLRFTAVALRMRFVDRAGHPRLQRGLTIAGGLLVAVIGGLMLVGVLVRPL